MNGQNRPILPPSGWVSAAMNRQAPPAMVNRLPMIILLISSGSRALGLHHFQKAATATSIEKLRIASSVISQLDGKVCRMNVRLNCWSPQTR